MQYKIAAALSPADAIKSLLNVFNIQAAQQNSLLTCRGCGWEVKPQINICVSGY